MAHTPTHTETPKTQNPLTERLLWAGAVILCYLAYYPVSQLIDILGRKAYDPILWIDRATPLSPDWMLVYAAVFLSAFVPVATVKSILVFRRTALSILSVQLTSYLCFLLIPVKVTMRPTHVDISSFTSWGLRFAYWIDPVSNCFPSLHVSLAFLAAFCAHKVDRLIGSLAITGAALIAASTMFVKQHYFVDVIGGIAIASLSYRLWVHPLNLQHTPTQELRYPRAYSLLLLFAHGLLVLGFYVGFRSGWQPWQP